MYKILGPSIQISQRQTNSPTAPPPGTPGLDSRDLSQALPPRDAGEGQSPRPSTTSA